MQNPSFDLERFKAGEPAYYVNVEITECFYFGELPDGKIVFRCHTKIPRNGTPVVIHSITWMIISTWKKES